MTIEFHCPHCEKLLKTADDKAGVRAKCPGCGEVVTVPAPQAEAAGFDASFEESFGGASGGSPPPIPVTSPAEPPAGPEEMRPCPMCGESIRAAATRCRYCGEVLEGAQEGEGVPTQIDAGEILSRSWGIFQKEMGMCIAIVLIAGFLNFLGQLPSYAVRILTESGVIDKDMRVVAVIAWITLFMMGNVFNFFLSIGQSIAMLKIARGQSAQISDLFAGSPYFWRAVGASILFGVMSLAGMLACLVGTVFVVLMFSPYIYALVDRDVGAVESLSVAYRITRNNLLALFVISLAVVGMSFLGFLTCGLGFIVIGPYIMLMQAVTYLQMSGLPIAQQRRPA